MPRDQWSWINSSTGAASGAKMPEEALRRLGLEINDVPHNQMVVFGDATANVA
jgi:hypothetical protein